MRAAGGLALFHYSLAYLALLFVAAALDPVVLWRCSIPSSSGGTA